MAQAIKVGIIGGGWPGAAHARGYKEAGGFKVVAVADLIPARRKSLIELTGATREYGEAMELVKDKDLELISVCLPTFLHAPVTIAALKAGKHVICEKPPTIDVKQAMKIATAATKANKVVMYAVQRRFGGGEQAAKQAIEKGYAGDVYHARASWMRTRGIPIGTGWFTDKSKSGGGALIDIGVHMLDLAWYLLGQPKPTSVFGMTHHRFDSLVSSDLKFDVDDAAFALIRFEGGKSLELSASWALNQPPQQQGTVCRIYGDKAAIDVYTASGSTLYRNFDKKGEASPTPLKPPRVAGHAALMRHLKQCIEGKAQPIIGAAQGVVLMQMIEGIYRSAASGKSVSLKG
jgi:predicted dehydrogenase